ncbi:MAG: sulfite exporter TauE/SafE family protein [Micropruina sp.]|nr:sulfite exporter TauE/SafE family protein [Micropruina sp.]
MAIGAVIMGFSKTSVGGLGSVTVAIFALTMPTRESTAAVLLLAIVGDVVAVATIGRHASRPLLLRLIPGVIPGLILGSLFLAWVDDVTLQRVIGGVLAVSLLIQLWSRRKPAEPSDPDAQHPAQHWVAAGSSGLAAGFTTMTANAGGPVMALYLLAARVDKHRFIGTNAWFFAVVNLIKVPFSASVGLFPWHTLLLVATLAPVVLVGTWFGRRFAHRISQAAFERITLITSLFAATFLLLR